MKKLSKVLGAITCAFVLLLTGMSLTACSFGSKAKLELYQSFKTEYAVGDSVDVTGGVLLYTNADGDERHITIDDSMVVSFNTEASGNKKMFIAYKDCEIAVNYTVYDDVGCESVAYCANPGYLGSGVAEEGRYDYFYFTSKTELLAMTTNVSTASIDKSHFTGATSIAVTSSIVNGKKVYVGTYASSNQITITVISASKIRVEISSGAVQLNYEASKITLN